MEEQYNDYIDHFDSDEIPAVMSLYINPETKDLSFACDWLDNNKSMCYIGEMLFQLKYSNLVDKIIENLQKQCVSEDRIENFNTIIKYINKRKQESATKESVAISPRDIHKL